MIPRDKSTLIHWTQSNFHPFRYRLPNHADDSDDCSRRIRVQLGKMKKRSYWTKGVRVVTFMMRSTHFFDFSNLLTHHITSSLVLNRKKSFITAKPNNRTHHYVAASNSTLPEKKTGLSKKKTSSTHAHLQRDESIPPCNSFSTSFPVQDHENGD